MSEKKARKPKAPSAPVEAEAAVLLDDSQGASPASVTFPDGREKKVDDLDDQDIQQIQQIIRASVEDVIRGSAAALDKMLNPFGLACKVIAFTYPLGANKEEVDALMLAAAGGTKNEPVTEPA